MPIRVKQNGEVRVFTDPAEAAAALLAPSSDNGYQEARRDELRQQLRAYEERYGIPSHRIHEAIDNGLTETLDVFEWIMTYEIYTALAGADE